MIKLLAPLRFIIVIIVGLFVSELISMGTIGVIESMSYLKLSLLDATLMILLATPLLYYFSLRPLLKVISEREAEIVQRKQVESQLRIQTTALETAANGVIVTNRQGEIIWTNEAFARMTQYTIDEILGKTPAFLNSGLHDLEFFRELWDTILAGAVWRGEITNRRKNGDLYITEQTITPVFNSAGDIGNFISIQQDISDRKRDEEALVKSEEKFRTLVDWTYDWEYWIDPQGNIVYASPSCGRITGYASDEFIADPSLIIKIVHPQDRLFYEKHHQLIHDATAGVKTVEFRIIARDGSEHWIEHVCRPLFDRDNRFMGRRISNRDITERKQAEESIRGRDQKENALRQTMHTMQIDIARDLHDTVGQNIGYLRMKLAHLSEGREPISDNVRMELEHMFRAADESYDLIRGTLAVLRSESLDDLFHLFARYAKQVEERSRFKVNIFSWGEPKPMSARRMRQLFYIYREALSNIEKHADASEVSIEMKWNEDCLTIAFMDNGQGFDVSFVQYGSHYGLKFMKERVELLDGSLSINSAPGAGTQTMVRLPYENFDS
jgi:PAS domain S-box-containing protein